MMIAQYRFSIHAPDNRPVLPAQAYPIYAWLLSQIPAAYGDTLHRQGEKPVSQYLSVSGKSAPPVWTLSCLNEEACTTLEPVLRGLDTIPLHTGTLKASLLDSQRITSVRDLTERARTQAAAAERARVQAAAAERARQQAETPFFRLSFCSPTAFKRDGQYVIFPEKPLLLHSLAEKWDSVFPAYPLRDAETLEALESGLKIVDYRLRSCRFPMKDVRIPGFMGQITIQARLAPPLLEVWKSLVYFSTFSGVGIKTTLGMGGIQTL